MFRSRSVDLFLCLLAIIGFSIASAEDPDDREILKRIVEKAKQNQELSEEIGFLQSTSSTKIRDGKISETKVRTHRVIWVEEKPYLELVKVNGQEPNAKERKEEKERREKFIKSLRKKDEDDDDSIQWEDLYSKYNFTAGPPDSVGRYVFKFRPKPGKLPQRSRTEKVLNHVTGIFWADENFNIVRAEAKLLDNVKFGLGILGNLEEFELTYGQRNFNDVHVPAFFTIHFKARVALLKMEERKIEGKYSDYFRRELSRR